MDEMNVQGVSILGIDPGIVVTGYALLDESPAGVLTFSRSGQVKTHAKMPFSERLKLIFDSILKVIDADHPVAVALEDTFFGKNAQSALKLGQARGVAILAAAFRGLPVFDYTPTAVKLAVVGHGSANKDQVQQMVARFLHLPKVLASEHQSDAAAVAICHAHSARFQKQLEQASHPNSSKMPRTGP